MQAPDNEPEELIPSPQAWTTLGAKGDLKLLAEKDVLDDEAPTAVDGGDKRGLCETDEFEHRGRIADHLSADRRAAFAPLQRLLGVGLTGFCLAMIALLVWIPPHLDSFYTTLSKVIAARSELQPAATSRNVGQTVR